MLSKLKKENEGFTIIEVLIVLAIAGLIILIVLLAVPALQRNQRNTSRKSDVGRIASSVNNFVSNNSGTLPSSTADATSVLSDAGTLAQYSLTAASPVGTAANNKLSIATGTQSALSSSGTDQVQIVTGAVCGTSGATTSTGATTRSIAIQYTLETGTNGTVNPICQNS